MIIKEPGPEFAEWLADRPEIIQEMTRRYHPYATYRLQNTNQLCTIRSFYEDGTVCINVFDELLMMFTHGVFGIDPTHLTECDVTLDVKAAILGEPSAALEN